jgi:uncharacterized protein (TIGR02118 family)
MTADDAPSSGGTVRLFAFVKRREGMSREAFLDYWHHTHGPLIRDTPDLRRYLVAYEQHPARADDRSGWDGVAMQQFASWDDFLAMISGPAGELMRADEANFLDPDSIRVVFTDDAVVVVPTGEDPS